ncbi:heavy-metal-associated domain-containing protein [Microbacterium luticocti]|uniref:heavy-metal-associated domain-containing protein n=1 Tax=Microbacterium luticocti TaxID=451764 RepID=UPI000405FC92|nr:cation transporter [Microbacterium luticocti]
MSFATYRVEGMTCNHCVQAVTREVQALAGVDQVAVDLQAKTVAVTGTASPDDIAGAVAEAGYTFAGPAS